MCGLYQNISNHIKILFMMVYEVFCHITYIIIFLVSLCRSPDRLLDMVKQNKMNFNTEYY